MSERKWIRWTIPLVFLIILVFLVINISKRLPQAETQKTVRVLAYSSFLNSWGPGSEIAKRFQAETGYEVQYQDAGDSGLLLKKLELFPSDVVVGLDQLALAPAMVARKWKNVPVDAAIPKDLRWKQASFLPFDWAPMAFVYREGEVTPPTSLDDLLDPRFVSSIALEDPRTSTPGLQFFFWVLDEKGIDGGFEYLAKLKPNLQSVGASWSAAYGAFTKKQAKLAFSYASSPIYHWAQAKDFSYKSEAFSSGQPAQVEYAGVPENCANCEAGSKFMVFLLKPEIQKLLMAKNFMFPVVPELTKGTMYDKLPVAPIRDWKSLPELLEKRQELFERWRTLGL